jgi:hypothetical protein
MQTRNGECVMIFRKLSSDEARVFRQSARKNYEPFGPINGLWHPVYQAECVKINDENATYTDKDTDTV